MKQLVLIIDGASDLPVAELGGNTPLEHAFMPHADWVAAHGRSGLVHTVFADLPVGSIVAALGILGYDPHTFYPNGRASFEALAAGIRLGPSDIAFRCNLISVDARDAIADFTAGWIADEQATALVLGIDTGEESIDLYPGQSYRNVLVVRNCAARASDFSCAPPHQSIGVRVSEAEIVGRSAAAREVAERLNRLQQESRRQLAALNLRVASKADMLWAWSPSASPALPSYLEWSGRSGAVVAGLDFFRGIGMAAGMLAPVVPGATGYLNSDFGAKAAEAIRLLEKVDVVFVHVNAADEEAHQRHLQGKIAALELIDEHVLGPVLRWLRRNHAGAYRLVVLPDHHTCVADGQHMVAPVPFAVCGEGVERDDSRCFSECEAARMARAIPQSWELMAELLAHRRVGGGTATGGTP